MTHGWLNRERIGAIGILLATPRADFLWKVWFGVVLAVGLIVVTMGIVELLLLLPRRKGKKRRVS